MHATRATDEMSTVCAHMSELTKASIWRERRCSLTIEGTYTYKEGASTVEHVQERTRGDAVVVSHKGSHRLLFNGQVQYADGSQAQITASAAMSKGRDGYKLLWIWFYCGGLERVIYLTAAPQASHGPAEDFEALGGSASSLYRR